MEKAFVVVRSVCKPKNKVSEEDIMDIRVGKWTGRQQKCYMHCVMELFGVAKRTKVLVDAAIKQFDVLLPDERKDSFKNALKVCQNEGQGLKDVCEFGFLLTKCFQEKIPNFVFP